MSNQDYGHKAYIETLMSYGFDSSSTHLDSTFWIKDLPGQMDELSQITNTALKQRYDRVKGSNTIKLMGKVHGDMLNQNRLLLNNVDLRIVFTIERPEYFIMEKIVGEGAIIFESATLYVDHVALNPTVMLQNEARLLKQPAIYPYRRVEIKAYTVPANVSDMSLNTVCSGLMPSLVLFAMVTNKAYVGQRNLNPFNYQHFNLSQFQLLQDSVSKPSEIIECNYDKPDFPLSTRAYLSLFKGIYWCDNDKVVRFSFVF